MDREELLALDNSEIAKLLNEAIAAGKSKDEALAEYQLDAPELMKQNIFWDLTLACSIRRLHSR